MLQSRISQRQGSDVSQSYPVLDNEKRSYPQGHYKADIQICSDEISAVINHHVSGAPFLERMIGGTQARYTCLVTIPVTGYKKLELSEQAIQIVRWQKEFLSKPIQLRPSVIAVQEVEYEFSAEDGVNEIWQGRKLTIPRGARLALGILQIVS